VIIALTLNIISGVLTLPSQAPDIANQVASTPTPPANITKPHGQFHGARLGFEMSDSDNAVTVQRESILRGRRAFSEKRYKKAYDYFTKVCRTRALFQDAI